MLEKKDVVQKSFRIHKQNEIWLGLLATKLGRTQNELVNIAIKMLLDDNKKWFFEYYIESIFRSSIGFDRDDCNAKKRLGDIEVELIPYDLNPDENVACLNITYYKDDSNDVVIKTKQEKIMFGPGYESRVLKTLVETFEPALNKYPQIMKEFNPGENLDEF